MDFIDIHSHVLYGLDDGAKTRETSVAMLEMAAANGTTDIVATPHANGQYAFRPDVIAEQIADLSGETSVRIHTGCDFHLQADNIADALEHPDKYTIDHNGYLLVEFPDAAVFHNTDDILFQLIDAGMVPVITHPERHPQLRERLDDIGHWVESGCYVQVTAASFMGVFGKAAKASAMELMERGLAHIVASDAHDLKFRTTNLSAAYAMLSDRYGEDRIRPLFVDNPAAMIAGRAVDIDYGPAPVRHRKWYERFGLKIELRLP